MSNSPGRDGLRPVEVAFSFVAASLTILWLVFFACHPARAALWVLLTAFSAGVAAVLLGHVRRLKGKGAFLMCLACLVASQIHRASEGLLRTAVVTTFAAMVAFAVFEFLLVEPRLYRRSTAKATTQQ